MKMVLDPDFYTLAAIENMVEQFSAYMSVESGADDGLCLTMTPAEGLQAEGTIIINTFLNNILELSIQERLINEG